MSRPSRFRPEVRLNTYSNALCRSFVLKKVFKRVWSQPLNPNDLLFRKATLTDSWGRKYIWKRRVRIKPRYVIYVIGSFWVRHDYLPPCFHHLHHRFRNVLLHVHILQRSRTEMDSQGIILQCTCVYWRPWIVELYAATVRVFGTGEWRLSRSIIKRVGDATICLPRAWSVISASSSHSGKSDRTWESATSMQHLH